MTDYGKTPPGYFHPSILGDIDYASALFDMADDETRKRAVWSKAMPIPGLLSNEWRKDEYGNTIRYSHYGDRHSDFGWEIDHARASALGGSDDHSNLRPLHCKVNASFGGIVAALLDRDR